MEDMTHDTSLIHGIHVTHDTYDSSYDNLYDNLYHTIKKKGSKNQYQSIQRKNITNMIINKKMQYNISREIHKIHSIKKNENTAKKSNIKFNLEIPNIEDYADIDIDNDNDNVSDSDDWEGNMWNDIVIRALSNPIEWYEQCLESYKYENKPDEIIVEHLYENIYIMWHSYLMIEK